MFQPQAIAVFGASDKPDSVAGRVYQNLIANGLPVRCIPSMPTSVKLSAIRGIPAPVDVAVIATPAATVSDILHQCGEHNLRAAIILSAGFTDNGEANSLQQALLQQASQYNIRLPRPNCLGLIRPRAKLNATFSNNNARRGNLALISQSGALCTVILGWAEQRNIGFFRVDLSGRCGG